MLINRTELLQEAECTCISYVERCGSKEGLDAGRHCLNRWGYRRCEDIVWIKTNNDPDRKYVNAANQEALSVLQHTKAGEVGNETEHRVTGTIMC